MEYTKNKRDLMSLRKHVLAVAVSTAIANMQTAHAADVLEEVIVTATKREVSMQDLAQSVTAFTTEDIERLGFRQLDDYVKHIPSLSFSRREPGGTSIVFRGVAASGIQFGATASSAVYLDEQPITAGGQNPDPRLIDIERVEALSGPQGTLFGSSSQSGTLRIITNKPDTEAFESWVEGTASVIDGGDTGYDISGMVNIPLVENKLALRLVGFQAEEAGFIDNVLSPSPGGTTDNANVVKDDVNSSTYSGGRASLRWNVSDNWRLDATAIVQELDVDGFSDVDLDMGDLEQVRFYDEKASDDWYQLGLTLEGDLGFADLTVATSYFDREFRYEADSSYYVFFLDSYLSSYYTSYDFGGDPIGHAINSQDTESYTVEARLASSADSGSRWNWLLGSFYNKTTSVGRFESNIDNFTDTPAFAYIDYNYGAEPTDTWFKGMYDQELEQVSVFGEVTMDITDHFSVTAGGRWFKFERSFDLVQESPAGVTNSENYLNESQSTDEDGWVPKFNTTYTFDDDRLVYFTYSEGFRVGGSNPVPGRSNLPRNYDSDTLTNYEVGAKTQWLDSSLRFNFAAYHMEWDDIQVQVEDTQSAVFATGFINFPSAEIDGMEASVAWIPADGWDISGTLAYNNAEISETSTQFGLTVENGTPLPLTPDWKGSLSVEYAVPHTLFGASPFVRFDYSYTGESVNALEGAEAVIGGFPVRTQDSYQIGDFSAVLEGELWSATLFVDNVWDERAELFFNNTWTKTRLSMNQPRTFGVRFRRWFK